MQLTRLKSRGVKKMARKNSDAKLRAVRKYNDKNYMQIGLRVPIADGEAFKAKCKEKGISQAEVLKNAIREFISE